MKDISNNLANTVKSCVAMICGITMLMYALSLGHDGNLVTGGFGFFLLLAGVGLGKINNIFGNKKNIEKAE